MVGMKVTSLGEDEAEESVSIFVRNSIIQLYKTWFCLTLMRPLLI